jgi:hypothetical protein
MLIGLRMLLMIAVIAISGAFVAFLFTRNPRLLQLTKSIFKVTVLFAAVIAVVYIAERVLFL